MQWMALTNLGYALIIPSIIALYLLKRKYENQEVSSILLWRQMLQDMEVNRPLQKLWKNLLLFLQLLVAILLVLALIKPALPTDGAIARHTVIVLDSSGSMLAKEGEHTRFDLAKQEVKQVIENLGSDQAVTLVEAGREPKVLIAKSGDQEALQNALQNVSPRSGTSENRTTFSLAKAIALSEPGSGIMWFGDGGSDHIPETEMNGVEANSFRFIQTGKKKENVSIGTFVTQKGAGGMEGLLRLDNEGIQRKTAKVVIYDANKQLLDAASVDIGAKMSQTISFAKLPTSPVYQATLEVEADGLTEDNQLWSVPFSTERASAVLVSPNGNRFLNEVLKIGDRLNIEKMSELPKNQDKSDDLWIYDGVVPDKLPKGNILLIAPNRAAEWLPYNGVKQVAARVAATQNDQLVQYVDWQEVHVAEAAQIGEITGMKPLVQAGDENLVLAGTIDGRRVVIVTFDLHQSDFPLRPAFPIFIQNAITWLSPVQSVPIGTGHPGEPLQISLTPGAEKRTLFLPDGSAKEITAEGTSYLYQVPELTGLYRFEETQGAGKQTRYFSVQMRQSETQITPQNIAVTANPTPENEQAKGQLQVKGINGYKDFTFWFVLLALMIAFAEWRVYQRGY